MVGIVKVKIVIWQSLIRKLGSANGVVSVSAFVIEVIHASHQMMYPSTIGNPTSIVSNESRSLNVLLIMLMCAVSKGMQLAACIVLPYNQKMRCGICSFLKVVCGEWVFVVPIK